MTSEGQNVTTGGGGYLALAAGMLCFYEHTITLGEEVRCVWRRRISGASILFLINRYAILTMSVASLVQVVPRNIDVGDIITNTGIFSTVCSTSLHTADVSLILANLAYVTFAALRMFALYGMSKLMFTFIIIVGLINPAGQVFLIAVERIDANWDNVTAVKGIPLGRLNCYRTLREKYTHVRGVNFLPITGYVFLALRAHALIFEAILVGLTCRKTLTRWSLQRAVVRTPYTTMLLRDGALYFIVIASMSGLNMAGALTFLISKTPHVGLDTVVVPLVSASIIADVVMSICMSRFILDLLAIALEDGSFQHRTTQWRTLRFASVVKTATDDLSADLHDNSHGTEEYEMHEMAPRIVDR